MHITPSAEPNPEGQSPEKSEAAPTTPAQPVLGLPFIVLAVVAVAGMIGLFFYNQSLSDRLDQMQQGLQESATQNAEALEQITRRLDQTDMRHAELQGEYTVTKDKLGMTQTELQRARQIAADLAKQQQSDAQQLTSQMGQLRQEQQSTQGNLGSLSTDVVGVKGDVKTTQAELAATKSELTRVIGDLGVQSGLIARNQADLADLRARGDRDYVEFDLTKASKRQRVGPLQLELRKTDVKRQKYTVNLIADDRTIEKKDKTVFEPVQFYRVGDRQATEIVVQQILKDRIVGYVSSPKHAEAPATANAQG
jgi:hypothetical protein